MAWFLFGEIASELCVEQREDRFLIVGNKILLGHFEEKKGSNSSRKDPCCLGEFTARNYLVIGSIKKVVEPSAIVESFLGWA
jgi:hypothetical protein